MDRLVLEGPHTDSNKLLTSSSISPSKKLVRSVRNQIIPRSSSNVGSSFVDLCLRRWDLSLPSVLQSINSELASQTHYVHSLDISYSITDKATIKVFCSYLLHLQSLVAVQCGLADIVEDTQWSKKLRTIDLSRNMLTSVPSGLCGLIELTELNLSGNAITELDSLILTLPKLRKFHLLNNPIGNVPKCVCREGVSGLRKFFKVNPSCGFPSESLPDTVSRPKSTSQQEKHSDLRRYVLHKQGSFESGYESSRHRKLSESTCHSVCSGSLSSDSEPPDLDLGEVWPAFEQNSLPDGYRKACKDQLCQVYLPSGCTADVRIKVIKDISLHPRVEPNELLISPVVRITPHGTTFPEDKPAIIVLPHCTMPSDYASLKIIPVCSNRHENQVPEWTILGLNNQLEIFQNCVTFSTTHFSLFAVISQISYPSTSFLVTPDTSGLLEIPHLPGFKITIPPNTTFSQETIIATSYFNDHPYAMTHTENSSASACVGLEPHGLVFQAPITISIPIPDYTEIKYTFPHATLQLYHAPNSGLENGNPQWVLAENQNCTISEESGFVIATFNTIHFSLYEFLWTVKDTASLGASYVYRKIFRIPESQFVSVRYQAFMSPPLGDQTFGLVVCVYKFGDPLSGISNYPWLVADSGENRIYLKVGELQVSLEGSFGPRCDLHETLNRSFDFRGEDFCARFEFALTLNGNGSHLLLPGQIFGKVRFSQFGAASKDCNLIMPGSVYNTQKERMVKLSSSPEISQVGELTPPWSPDTDIQMDYDEVFVDQPGSLIQKQTNHCTPQQCYVTKHPQPVLTQLPQPVLTMNTQPVLSRGKHGRHTPTQVNHDTLTFPTTTRAKRRLFLRDETISDKTLLAISQEVCSKYVDLGIGLGLSYSTIESSTGSVGTSKPEHLKAFYVLQNWKQSAGSNFTFTELAKALEDVGLATVAQKYCYTEE